ncbi:MAG: Gfo/Idh/MocA family protein [Candidatus Binatia bacterium]
MSTAKDRRDTQDGPGIRVALVGCGRIADLQCLGYLDHPRASIVAVCDPDEEKARSRAVEWGAELVYTEFEALLDDPGVDVIDILTPHDLHAKQAVGALAAGKHVSLQKPPARDLAEFDEIATAARKSRRLFRVFDNFMHYPPHVKARELVEAGDIGEPVSVRIKTAAGQPSAGWTVDPDSLRWRVDPERCGGGPITFDHGYHCYSMGRFFMPEEIDRVHAFINWTELPDGSRYDGPAMVTWTYEGTLPRYGSWEVIASLQMQVRSDYYVSDDRIEIHGTEGIIWINRCTGKLLDEPSLVVYRGGQTRAFHDLESDWAESFRLGGRDFIDAILRGQRPRQDVEEARQTLAFAFAAALSAEEAREVTIAEILDKA